MVVRPYTHTRRASAPACVRHGCQAALRDSGNVRGLAVRDDHLHAFVGDARAHAASDARRRRRWLARQLDEDRTFDDVCRRAAGDDAPVDVVVAGGRVHRGRLTAVGAALMTVAVADGGTAYISRDAVVGVRLRPPGAAGDRPAPSAASGGDVADGSIGDVARELADRGADVRVGTAAGALHRGRIAGVGRDVLRFVDGLHLRLDVVIEVITIA